VAETAEQTPCREAGARAKEGQGQTSHRSRDPSTTSSKASKAMTLRASAATNRQC